jgi:chromosome segregation ATPase/DNA-directed RNA polymerase subunit RPC12/RpoP
MADLKFACPECKQRILVDDGAAGVQIECPMCRSTVVIPARASDPVQVIKRRRHVVATFGSSLADDELKARQKEFEAVAAESKNLREEAERSGKEIAKLREALQAAAAERDRLRATTDQTGVELGRLKTEEKFFKTELEKARSVLDEAQKKTSTLEQELKAKTKALEDANSAQGALEEARGEVTRILRERDTALAEAGKAKQELKALNVGPARPALPEMAALEKEVAELRAQLTEARMAPRATDVDAPAQIKKLQDELAAATAERDRIKADANQSGTNLGALRSELDTAKNNLDAQHKKLRELGESFAKSERERMELHRRLSESGPVQELAATREKLTTAQAQLIDAQNSALTFRGERDKVRQQLTERDEAVKKATDSTDALRAELERSRQEADVERERLKSALAAHATELQASRTEAANLAKSEATTAIEKMKTESGAAVERAASLQRRTETLERELAAARTDLDALRKAEPPSAWTSDPSPSAPAPRISASRRSKPNSRSGPRNSNTAQRTWKSISACVPRNLLRRRKNLSLAREEREEALKATTAKEKELREISIMISAATARAEEAQSRVETLASELDRARAEFKSEREKLQSLETGLAPMQEKIRLVEAERDRLKANLDKLSGQVEGASNLSQQARIDQAAARTNVNEVERQLEQALDRVRTLEGERDRLREEIDGTKQGLDRSKQHINVLQARRDQMRDEIARLKVKLGMAPDAVV